MFFMFTFICFRNVVPIGKLFGRVQTSSGDRDDSVARVVGRQRVDEVVADLAGAGNAPSCSHPDSMLKISTPLVEATKIMQLIRFNGVYLFFNNRVEMQPGRIH